MIFMADTQIHSDPERLLALAEELRNFGAKIRTELETLQSALQKLGGTWRDEEYAKFKRAFDKAKTELEQLAEEIKKREPELKADAQLLLDYLRKSL